MQFKTTPRAKQLVALERSEGKDFFAYFMEMRTGKTKVTLDDAARAYFSGKINCLVVLAPNGVHRDWVELQCKDHMAAPHICTYYSANCRVAHKRQFEKARLDKSPRLKVITFNIEAAASKRGQALIVGILKDHDCMLAVDESDLIKSPGATCTKFLLRVAPLAVMRRILTGTPITQTPLGLYTQLKFLSPTILKHSTYTSFRSRYAVIKRVLKREAAGKVEDYCNENSVTFNDPADIPWSVIGKLGIVPGRDMYDDVVGFKNMDELERLVSPHCYRLKASECEDLPALVPMKLSVELTAEQRRIYNEMIEDAIAYLTPVPENPADIVQWYLDNDKLEASNALTKFLRAQQVLGGHVPDANGNLRYFKHNRIKTLLDFLPQVQGKVIIWANFRPEIDEIVAALKEAYPDNFVAEFHGGIDKEQRNTYKKAFQNDPQCKFLVGQPRAGGVGHTFDAADTVIFYSNGFSARMRWQAEVRASAVGKQSIAVVDLVAHDTIEEKILSSLDTCRKMADDFNYEA